MRHTQQKNGWALYTARRAFSTLTKTWSVAGEKKTHKKYWFDFFQVHLFWQWLCGLTQITIFKISWYIITKYFRFQYSNLFKLTVKSLEKYVGQIHNCIIEFLFEFKRKHNCIKKLLKKAQACLCLHTSAQHRSDTTPFE